MLRKNSKSKSHKEVLKSSKPVLVSNLSYKGLDCKKKFFGKNYSSQI